MDLSLDLEIVNSMTTDEVHKYSLGILSRMSIFRGESLEQIETMSSRLDMDLLMRVRMLCRRKVLQLAMCSGILRSRHRSSV